MDNSTVSFFNQKSNPANILIYTHLVEFEDNEYDATTASNIDEAKRLLEDGWEYTVTCNDAMLLRKRK